MRRYILRGLDCANCAAELERALQREDGLKEARVSFATSSVELNPEHLARARGIIAAKYPEIELVAREETAGTERKAQGFLRELLNEQRRDLIRIGAALVLLILGLIFEKRLHLTPYCFLEYAIYLTAYLLVGYGVLWSAARNAVRGIVSDETTLMSIATFGAIAIHQLPEAVAVMLFYSIGETLQDFAVDRSRRSVSALMDVRPDQARVKRGDDLLLVRPEEVSVNETIVVQPGERVPLDGEVSEGESFVDTAALTGESVPRRLSRGSQALAGMVCTSGILSIRTTKPAAESAIARILRLVEDAAGRKARTEQAVTTFARYYTPAVVAAAICLVAVPPLLIPGAAFSTWLYRALVLLVISCPCALVISVPLGYFGGIGGASRHGILIKGANFLEVLADLDTVAFDKTGTLTEGTFRVATARPANGFTEAQVLEAAARAEAASPHPIAASILAAYGKQVDPNELEDYEELAGYGVKGRWRGKTILAGNDRFMHREGIPHEDTVCDLSGTVVHVAVEGIYAGHLTIADEIRHDAALALQGLRAQGIRRMALLSGDDECVARQVGKSLQIDLVHANLLPGDKVALVEALTAEIHQRKGKLAFVGDGMNDAPVLTRADVGIAMGGLGSDAAIEAADVVIMDDQLRKLPAAVQIARRTRRIVFQNIGFAFGVKAIFMLLGAWGVASIWEAVFADVGVSLLAVLNATRTLRYRPD